MLLLWSMPDNGRDHLFFALSMLLLWSMTDNGKKRSSALSFAFVVFIPFRIIFLPPFYLYPSHFPLPFLLSTNLTPIVLFCFAFALFYFVYQKAKESPFPSLSSASAGRISSTETKSWRSLSSGSFYGTTHSVWSRWGLATLLDKADHITTQFICLCRFHSFSFFFLPFCLCSFSLYFCIVCLR